MKKILIKWWLWLIIILIIIFIFLIWRAPDLFRLNTKNNSNSGCTNNNCNQENALASKSCEELERKLKEEADKFDFYCQKKEDCIPVLFSNSICVSNKAGADTHYEINYLLINNCGSPQPTVVRPFDDCQCINNECVSRQNIRPTPVQN